MENFLTVHKLRAYYIGNFHTNYRGEVLVGGGGPLARLFRDSMG